MDSYPILGSFTEFNYSFKFDIALAVPPLSNDRKPGKLILSIVGSYESSVSDGLPNQMTLPVLFLIVSGNRQIPRNANEVPDNSLPDCLDFSEIKTSRNKSAVLKANTSQVLTIVFHSDQDPDKIINCFKTYLDKGLYQFYLGKSVGESFASYYRANCMKGLELAQPETSGGGILVGG